MVVARKALIAVGVLVVIGVVVGIIINFTSGGDNENANTRTSGKSLTNTVRDRTPDVSESDLLTNSTSNSSGSTFYEPESDPEEAKVALTMIAIGDWGATTDKPGSCCNKYRKVANDSLEMKIDYWSQINIAELMAQAASDIKPLRIIGHGDNIYWNGAGPGDIEYRMETTFESVYDQPELKGIPWINVVGNHDLGGSEYICGDKDYNFRECKSTEELLKYLNLKFTLQQKYKSANSDRWKLSDHYYVESVKANGVSVDIFNIDTNFADSHGVMQICCQCYGYVKKKDLSAAEAKKLGSTCNDRIPGDELCAGGNIEMYNACADTIKSWWDDSLKQVKRDLMASTATWKVINSHYSPHFHMSEDKMKEWFLITKEGGAHVWLNGHTHGFNHDISNWGTHFYENGGGGGIQSETSGMPPMVAKKYVKHAWIAAGNPYGFFMLHFSEDWLKTEFVTFDNSWTFSINKDEIVKGGYQKGHCWHIPVTVGVGKECAKSRS